MKRLAVCLVLAAAFTLIQPDAAQAAYCRCGPLVTTPTSSGFGGNCSVATDNLEANLWTYISCYICREPVLTSSCTTTGGEDPFAFATGYFSYRCYQLGGGCQIP